MNIFEKKAQYLKYFEDIYLIDIDNENDRITIIFNGKENIIYIFDLKPYINYFPIEEEIVNNTDSSALQDKKVIKEKEKIITANDIGKLLKKDNQEFVIYNDLNNNIPKQEQEQEQIYENYFENVEMKSNITN